MITFNTLLTEMGGMRQGMRPQEKILLFDKSLTIVLGNKKQRRRASTIKQIKFIVCSKPVHDLKLSSLNAYCI